MISLLATLLWHLADILFSLSLSLHRCFHTPFWQRAEAGIARAELQLEEMRQLIALAELGEGQ